MLHVCCTFIIIIFILSLSPFMFHLCTLMYLFADMNYYIFVRAKFVYGCTCKCMECCSNLIGQTNQIDLTMQHDNG